MNRNRHTNARSALGAARLPVPGIVGWMGRRSAALAPAPI